jgi:hypothetical protein
MNRELRPVAVCGLLASVRLSVPTWCPASRPDAKGGPLSSRPPSPSPPPPPPPPPPQAPHHAAPRFLAVYLPKSERERHTGRRLFRLPLPALVLSPSSPHQSAAVGAHFWRWILLLHTYHGSQSAGGPLRASLPSPTPARTQSPLKERRPERAHFVAQGPLHHSVWACACTAPCGSEPAHVGQGRALRPVQQQPHAVYGSPARNGSPPPSAAPPDLRLHAANQVDGFVGL